MNTWNCYNCGAILGEIDRTKGLNKLSIRGILITGRADVTCEKCGAVREWFADAEAIRRLIRMTGRRAK